MSHDFPVRIYYEDTDAGGVVYHANYLKFTERARTEFIRTLGFECSTIEQKLGMIFVVRHISADYFAPARLDDSLVIKTSVDTVKNSSFVLKQSAHKGADMLFDSRVTLVCVDTTTFKPMKIPSPLRAVLDF